VTEVAEAVGRIRAWGEAREWRGYDPYDGLNSPAARALPRLGRRIFTQAVKLSPINLRPLLRIRPDWNPKAIALVASGYARLARRGDRSARDAADGWLHWLAAQGVQDSDGVAWGYPFDVDTRVSTFAAGTPNTIATSFVAHGFLDAYELLGEENWADQARRSAAYLVRHMLIQESGATYFCYHARESLLVHNANMLACGVLGRVARLLDEPFFVAPMQAAAGTTVKAQREDGSWPYSEAHAWIDNFHTAYVLAALAECSRSLPELGHALQHGVAFWESRLFSSDGAPKYYAHRALPEDAHSYATAIDTWLALADDHPHALEHAERVADLLITRMLDPSGYIHFQRRRFLRNTVPFIRWTTAPSFRALAGLLLALEERRRPRTGRAIESGHARLD
jgi:hypothetical protein